MGLAVVTGVQGQDGSILADYLLELGHEVLGVARRKSSGETNANIEHLISHPKFILIYGDITDDVFVETTIQKYRPEFYFNLAAMSHVGQSFKEPLKTFDTNATAVVKALESIRRNSPNTKFYQASTSEMFGGIKCPAEGYDEAAAFHPRSPYGVSKAAAFHAVVNFREAYGLHASNGILFNHSSTRRGEDFATRKITKGVANIVKGKQKTLKMGNMEAFRDEGHAKDYVRAMYLLLQQDVADDYVVATGEGATIREMLDYVCSLAGLKYDDVYEMNPEFMRPSEVPYLKGNPAKVKKLGWKPEHTWKDLLKEMYEKDLKENS